MITIPVALSERSYNIIIKPGILEQCPDILGQFISHKKCGIVTDSNVAAIYGNTTKKLLNAAAAETDLFTFKAGEEQKTLNTVSDICCTFSQAQFDRSSYIIALGGGVVGDLAGFAAAIYMRGINFIQIPTTLLAMVDSSVGGKTGADLPQGKNLIGAFWQPKLVIIDPRTLQTLPVKEIRCGLAEIVKYGVIMDNVLFSDLENNIAKLNSLDIEYFTKIIARCCQLKADVVAGDERESGRRGILNYGHTFGHAIELVSNFTIAHGEAIAIGMNIAAELALANKLIDAADVQRQRNLFNALQLPCHIPGNMDIEAIYQAMMRDKKKVGAAIKFVIPRQIGNVEISSSFDKINVVNAMEKCHD